MKIDVKAQFANYEKSGHDKMNELHNLHNANQRREMIAGDIEQFEKNGGTIKRKEKIFEETIARLKDKLKRMDEWKRRSI